MNDYDRAIELAVEPRAWASTWSSTKVAKRLNCFESNALRFAMTHPASSKQKCFLNNARACCAARTQKTPEGKFHEVVQRPR